MICPSYELFFKNLSSKSRLAILKVLQKGDKSVGEICVALNEEQSKVSHDLAKLAECNIVEVRPEGKLRIYSLNKDTIVPILKLVDNHVTERCSKCRNKITKIDI